MPAATGPSQPPPPVFPPRAHARGGSEVVGVDPPSLLPSPPPSRGACALRLPTMAHLSAPLLPAQPHASPAKVAHMPQKSLPHG